LIFYIVHYKCDRVTSNVMLQVQLERQATAVFVDLRAQRVTLVLPDSLDCPASLAGWASPGLLVTVEWLVSYF